jgi:hypothetical protein
MLQTLSKQWIFMLFKKYTNITLFILSLFLIKGCGGGAVAVLHLK